jgi:hypothetical protein
MWTFPRLRPEKKKAPKGVKTFGAIPHKAVGGHCLVWGGEWRYPRVQRVTIPVAFLVPVFGERKGCLKPLS